MAEHPGVYFSNHGLNFVTVTEAGTLVEGVAGKRIVVLGYVVTGESTITFKDGTDSWALAESASYSGGPFAPAFICGAGADLELEGAATGHLTYVLV